MRFNMIEKVLFLFLCEIAGGPIALCTPGRQILLHVVWGTRRFDGIHIYGSYGCKCNDFKKCKDVGAVGLNSTLFPIRRLLGPN